MRALLAGLAALTLFVISMSFMMPDRGILALDDVVIVAPAADLGATAALGGVVVTQTDALTGADVITLNRAKWDYGNHTARQLAAVSGYNDFDMTEAAGSYTNYMNYYADGGRAAFAADLNGQEAGWVPGAHTERMHRLGALSITTT